MDEGDIFRDRNRDLVWADSNVIAILLMLLE